MRSYCFNKSKMDHDNAAHESACNVKKKTMLKEKLQQKSNSSYLKEIRKQCIEIYYNIFISVLLQ